MFDAKLHDRGKMTDIRTTLSRLFRTSLWVVLIASGLLLLSACVNSPDAGTDPQTGFELTRDSVVIAAAWPWSTRLHGLYWEGMKMARDEINDRGGVLGRKLVITRVDDHESVNEGRRVAQRLADNPDIDAVIGHLNSHVSIPAAAIYDASGMLMLTPASTSPELTQNNHTLIFRSVNSDTEIARQMAEFAASRLYHRIIICYVRNAYGFGLANAFEQHAQELGLKIADRQFYDPSITSNPLGYQRLIDQWRDIEFDAIFLAGMAPQAGFVVKHVREAGMPHPIFGGDALDTPELISTAGTAAEGMIVASVFHPDDPRPEVREFDEAFSSRYGLTPDSWAARGYEAVRLLAETIEEAQSVSPQKVADRLRSAPSIYSLNGPIRFAASGDVVGKDVVKIAVSSGNFVYLDEKHSVPRPMMKSVEGIQREPARSHVQ